MAKIIVALLVLTAITGASCNWLGRVYSELQAAGGWTVPAGVCPSVGIAGHALGGGWGYVTRQFGVLSDAILAMTLVDADGVVRQVDNRTDPDLFWALRGAGAANFGIVTQLPARVAKAFYSWPDNASLAASVLRAFTAQAPLLPAELTASLGYRDVAASPNTSVSVVRTGPAAGFEDLLSDFIASFPSGFSVTVREFETLNELLFAAESRDASGLPLGDLQHRGVLLKAVPPLAFKATSVVVDGTLSPAGIQALIHGPWEANSTLQEGTWFQVHSLGGVVADLSANATAFPLRSRNMSIVQMYTSWTDPSDAPDRKAMMRQWRASVAPHVTPFAYANYIDRDVPVSAYYGQAGLERLAGIKRRVDPSNMWRSGQSIPLQ